MNVKDTVCPHCNGVVFSRMTKAQQAEAIAKYMAGSTLFELSEFYNRDLTTIRRLMAKNGVKKRGVSHGG